MRSSAAEGYVVKLKEQELALWNEKGVQAEQGREALEKEHRDATEDLEKEIEELRKTTTEVAAKEQKIAGLEQEVKQMDGR